MQSMVRKLIMGSLFWVLVWQSSSAAGDQTGMYTAVDLTAWKNILKPWVSDVVQEEIRPYLSAKEQEILREIKVDMPDTSVSGDPFDYEYSAHTLIIPVMNVKFLYDISGSWLWLDDNGFENPILLYLQAMKYQDASKFPDRRYPPPFEALGIPHNRLMDLNDGTISPGHFHQLFHGALLFILAHEVGHALRDRKNQNSLSKESQADTFAFEILKHAEFTPVGMAMLFMCLSVWDQNAADFPTPQKYKEWLKTTSRHPLTGARLRQAGSQLKKHSREFLWGTDDPASRMERMAVVNEVGSRMLEIADRIDDLTANRRMRDAALAIDVGSLAVHKRKS